MNLEWEHSCAVCAMGTTSASELLPQLGRASQENPGGTGVTGTRLLWGMDMGWCLGQSASSKVHLKMLQGECRDHRERNFFSVCS